MKLLLAFLVTTLLLAGGPAHAWNLAMPDTLRIGDGPVTLADLAVDPVPASAASLVVHGGGRPHTTVNLSRQGLLRRLVDAGLARDVRMTGATTTCLVFDGQMIDDHDLEEAVRRAVQPHVPSGRPGAPASWLDLQVPTLGLAVDDTWNVEVVEDPGLVPGRNLVACRLVGSENRERFTVSVELHVYGEVATAASALPRDTALDPVRFAWTWMDLADAPQGTVIGRESLAGKSLNRSITAGTTLRTSDIDDTPVIRAGDGVDLTITRGSLAVTVQGTARQAGCLGQTIPVRNEVSGRLVHARVTGPGLVEWRK